MPDIVMGELPGTWIGQVLLPIKIGQDVFT